ncbi:MAG TPA: TrkH family potassium uptake protein [Longimicrobiales bacterium]|jgi:trk system potassium uptake protein TrkH
MSLRHVANIVGLLQVFIALAMVVTGVVALMYGDGDALPIFASAVVTFAAGVTTYRLTRLESDLTHREGYAIVTFAWAGTAVFGALPYLFAGVTASPAAALFESMSGFTTTGATIFTDIEALPHGILFWRSFTHWLGGMGIIVLAIAVLPFLGVGGMQLFQAEVPGPTPERLRPRITQTAKLLWLVYLGLTVAQSGLYLLGGMSLFDSVTHTFSTLATGGFSTKNASMAGFESPYIHWVTIAFMYLAGVNFSLHFRAVTGRLEYFRDHEWRFYTGVVLGSAVLVAAINLASGSYLLNGPGLEAAARDALFQATSLTTTTGFVTADYELWLPSSQCILFALMFVGGMAGSTGGSMKAVRVLLLLKHTAIQLRKHLHPRAIVLARVGRRVVSEDVMANIVGFVILYFLLLLAGAVAMSFLGMDLVTAFSASVATVGNVGPGLGDVGPTDNYGWMSAPAMVILSFLMLVGRLEIYTVLLLLHPETWKRRGASRRLPSR